jgi:ketosteroid isomerase-like protein
MSELTEVRAASSTFYNALNCMAAGDAEPMAEAWARTDDVSALHPIGGRDLGYDAVIASFSKVAEIAGGGQVRIEDQMLMLTDELAVETGVETGTLVIAGRNADIHHRVTNVYRRVNGQWKLVHHHTDTSAAMLDIVKDLAAAE